MKKIAYIAPEMEEINLNLGTTLLAESFGGEEPEFGGSGEPGVNDPS